MSVCEDVTEHINIILHIFALYLLLDLIPPWF